MRIIGEKKNEEWTRAVSVQDNNKNSPCRRRRKLKGLMRSGHSGKDKEGGGKQEEQRNGLRERNVGNHKEKIGERGGADRIKSARCVALKCWKVFRCVRANRGVKAPFRPILPERSRLRVYKVERKGMKGFSEVAAEGWNIGDFRRIQPARCWA